MRTVRLLHLYRGIDWDTSVGAPLPAAIPRLVVRGVDVQIIERRGRRLLIQTENFGLLGWVDPSDIAKRKRGHV